jgi:hypothetical protein
MNSQSTTIPVSTSQKGVISLYYIPKDESTNIKLVDLMDQKEGKILTKTTIFKLLFSNIFASKSSSFKTNLDYLKKIIPILENSKNALAECERMRLRGEIKYGNIETFQNDRSPKLLCNFEWEFSLDIPENSQIIRDNPLDIGAITKSEKKKELYVLFIKELFNCTEKGKTFREKYFSSLQKEKSVNDYEETVEFLHGFIKIFKEYVFSIEILMKFYLSLGKKQTKKYNRYMNSFSLPTMNLNISFNQTHEYLI